MLGHRWLHLLVAGAVLALAGGCVSNDVEPLTGVATLHLDDDEVDLTVTRCALVGGRLLTALPDGGSELTLVAEGRDAAGTPVRLTIRRGTDVRAPHRFDLVEVSVGEFGEQGGLDRRGRPAGAGGSNGEVAVTFPAPEVLVLFRGLDTDTGVWTEIDPSAPTARREVPGALVHVDGAGLTMDGTALRPPDGRRVRVSVAASCPPGLEPAPGTA